MDGDVDRRLAKLEARVDALEGHTHYGYPQGSAWPNVQVTEPVMKPKPERPPCPFKVGDRVIYAVGELHTPYVVLGRRYDDVSQAWRLGLRLPDGSRGDDLSASLFRPYAPPYSPRAGDDVVVKLKDGQKVRGEYKDGGEPQYCWLKMKHGGDDCGGYLSVPRHVVSAIEPDLEGKP